MAKEKIAVIAAVVLLTGCMATGSPRLPNESLPTSNVPTISHASLVTQETILSGTCSEPVVTAKSIEPAGGERSALVERALSGSPCVGVSKKAMGTLSYTISRGTGLPTQKQVAKFIGGTLLSMNPLGGVLAAASDGDGLTRCRVTLTWSGHQVTGEDVCGSGSTESRPVATRVAVTNALQALLERVSTAH